MIAEIAVAMHRYKRERRAPEWQTPRNGPVNRSHDSEAGLLVLPGLWSPRLPLWGAAIPSDRPYSHAAGVSVVNLPENML